MPCVCLCAVLLGFAFLLFVLLYLFCYVLAICDFFFLILLPLLFAFPFIILFNRETSNSHSLNSLPTFLSALRLDHQSGAWQKVNDYYCRVILFLMKPYAECGAGRHHYSCFDVQIRNDTFLGSDTRRDHRKETGGGVMRRLSKKEGGGEEKREGTLSHIHQPFRADLVIKESWKAINWDNYSSQRRLNGWLSKAVCHWMEINWWGEYFKVSIWPPEV